MDLTKDGQFNCGFCERVESDYAPDGSRVFARPCGSCALAGLLESLDWVAESLERVAGSLAVVEGRLGRGELGGR
jgi:hypothetical protein